MIFELIRVNTFRIYAVTLKNIPVTIGFAVITTVQLALGLYNFALIVRGGGKVRLSDKKFSLMGPDRSAVTVLV